MKRICIVSPGLSTHSDDGEIGCAVYHLTRVLSENRDNEITLIVANNASKEEREYWHDYFVQLNVRYVHISELSIPDFELYSFTIFDNFFLKSAFIIFQYLNSDYHFIHFQDKGALGFFCIQAKKTGICFQHTVLTVTMHSPSQWSNIRQRKWLSNVVPETGLSWCERYCYKNADLLISPTRYMVNWALKRGITLGNERLIIQNCYLQDRLEDDRQLPPGSPEKRRIVFIGEYIQKRDLLLFISVISRILNDDISKIKDIYLILNNSIEDINFIKEMLNDTIGRYSSLTITVKVDLPTIEIISLLVGQNILAVLFLPMSNCPYLLIELIEKEIPFISSRVGSVDEMVSTDCLFEKEYNSLKEKLLGHLRHVDEITHTYSSTVANDTWLHVHNAKTEYTPSHRLHSEPKVSVCIPFYNHGRYFPALLRSLRESDYSNFEVIAVNDGSTDADANDVFEKMKSEYSNDGWLFFSKENRGAGHTRNYAARMSKGDYIIFMDSDNIARPDMIHDFVHGIITSGVDCLTCHTYAFSGKNESPDFKDIVYATIPIGPCLEIGFIHGVFGDANLIVKRDVFMEGEGFLEERNVPTDWLFLAKLSLEGYKQDVIPKPLYWYRELKGSTRKALDMYKTCQRVLDLYRDVLPNNIRFLLDDYALPLHSSYQELWQRHHKEMSILLNSKPIRIAETINRYPLLKRIGSLVATLFIQIFKRDD